MPPGSWVKPYAPASFTANQTYQYVCPCVNSGNQNTLGKYTITRSVTENSDGTFEYTITKSSGESATLIRYLEKEMPMRAATLLFVAVVTLYIAFHTHKVSASAATDQSQGCAIAVQALESLSRLKPGSLRSDVEKDFEPDGGLSMQYRATYTFRRCRYVKIDVEFKPQEREQKEESYSPSDQISKISSLYLAYPVSD
jgi:hypothetical protein